MCGSPLPIALSRIPAGLLAFRLLALGRLLAWRNGRWLPPLDAAARALTPRTEVGVSKGAVRGRRQARPKLGVDSQHLHSMCMLCA